MFSRSIVTPPSPYSVTAATSCVTTRRRASGRVSSLRSRPASKVVRFCAFVTMSRICGRSAGLGRICLSVYGTFLLMLKTSESPPGATKPHSQITQSMRAAWFLSETNELSSQLT